jgi:putative transposase
MVKNRLDSPFWQQFSCFKGKGKGMPRANRLLLPGHVWHITHRCHQREFLLKFDRDRDRQRWRYWLFEARKRFGLGVLNYVVTSNHVHLLVVGRGQGEIARSMQLIAGRTAQEYNQRKQRRGAYWAAAMSSCRGRRWRST